MFTILRALLAKKQWRLSAILIFIAVLLSVTACSINQVKDSSHVHLNTDQRSRLEAQVHTGDQPYEFIKEASGYSASDNP